MFETTHASPAVKLALLDERLLTEELNPADFATQAVEAGVPFAEATEADFDRLTNIHFKGVFFLTQKLLPMIEDGGKIVNLSSGLARFAYPGASIYGSLKGAVEVLTRYLARELGPRGISVNTLAPGAIATDFNGGLVRDNPELNQRVAAQTALGRVGLPDDIGGAVAIASGTRDEGPMPNLDGSQGWLNSAPLSSKALRGKVVLVNFWTYSCINSLRELPYMKAWAAK